MGLTKYRLGEFLLLYNEKCGIPNLSEWDISGVNSEKEFFEPSRQVGIDTSSYKNVPPGYFACNLMHVGRDRVLPIGLNHSNKTKVVSPAYTIFKIKDSTPLLKDYFFIMLKSKERDRYFWFHTDSSIRDGMSWDDFCELEVELPSLDIQQKYIDIYNAMLANQQSYESGLDDLKVVCDGYIEKLRRSTNCEKIGPYLIESDTRNNIGLSVDKVMGLTTSKEIISTKANMDGVELANYKLLSPGQLAYVPDTSRRGDKVSLGFNNSDETYLVSTISIVFGTKKEKLLPQFLFLFLTRSEFDRYARFNSWGSARETFNFDDMCEVCIPIPELSIQESITNIHSVWRMRKCINERLKQQLKDLCPILIKGSIEEAKAQA